MNQTTIHKEPTQYLYDSKTWLYRFMYVFFYDYVQKTNYTYDVKSLEIANILPITSYTYDSFSNTNTDYDYFCGNMAMRTQYTYDCDSAIVQAIMPSSETGFDYFGARFPIAIGSSDLSVWLSVDPMSDMYLSTSPYMYVRGNPVMLVDPNGMFDDWYENEDGQLLWTSESKDAITFNGSEYKNLNKGSDILPNDKKNGNGANLYIAGQNSGDHPFSSDNGTWQKQTEQTVNTPSENGKTNIIAIAENTDDLIKAFEVTSSEFGEVSSAFIRSHAYGGIGDNDFALNIGSNNSEYFGVEGISIFSKKLGNSINITGTLTFMGCNTDNIARYFTITTGISSIGSVGGTGPFNANGVFQSDGGFFRYVNKYFFIQKESIGNNFNASN